MIYIILILYKKGDIVKIREFLGSTVLDKNANIVGKVEDVDLETESGKIEEIILTLQKNIFSKDELQISFDDVETIGEYILLNKEINTEQAEESETVEVKVEDA